MNIILLIEFFISFFVTLLFTPILIKKLKDRGIVGRDMHKPDRPLIPDTGGLAVIFGVLVAVLFVIAYNTFFDDGLNTIHLMVGLLTILILEIIGFYDDLFNIPQSIKAVLPMIAAIPLMAIAAGTTTMSFPVIGAVDFGIFYVLVLIPLGITVASNLTNMLAGFNGSEVGMGIIIFITMSLIFLSHGSTEPLIISLAMLGALAAFMMYNWYPAKIFPGDATTFLIGGTLATVVILGNAEAAGALLTIPYVIDFFIKAKNGFPKSFAIFENGKLYPPKERIRGLGDLLLKTFNGLKEVHLTLILIGIETIVAMVVLILYL
ncbi:hypothetical protein J7J90_02665 [Candidatus Micrarchaeota archaeon]|nr:hypothetical protein [Candidatus Micrarchaeota archaeon]